MYSKSFINNSNIKVKRDSSIGKPLNKRFGPKFQNEKAAAIYNQEEAVKVESQMNQKNL